MNVLVTWMSNCTKRFIQMIFTIQIPKGFPYFAVDFGMQGGFAHVIEDERQFPKYFGKVQYNVCL